MRKTREAIYLREDRGQNHAIVSSLRSAVRHAETFLSTSAGDKESRRGSFTAAAQSLIAAHAITHADFQKVGIADGLFNPLSRGEKVDGIATIVKRRLIQIGEDTAKSTLLQDFGVRL